MNTAPEDPDAFDSWDQPRQEWLLGGAARPAGHRTLLLEIATRALFPTVLVFSLYLLIVGHYGPGGGFSAGLVAGLAFVLRYVAGGTEDVGGAMRVRPPVVIGVGLTVAVVTALAPAVLGAPVLSSAKLAADLPLLGSRRGADQPLPRHRRLPAHRRCGPRPAARAGCGHREGHARRRGTRMTTINVTMALVVGGVFAAGFYLLLQRSLMRVLIGVVVLGHGTNLLLQLAGGPPGRDPIVGEAPVESIADPLPQALALTAVVITFALTTFLLALAYRSFVLIGNDEVQDDVEDRRIASRRPAADLEDDDLPAGRRRRRTPPEARAGA